MNRMLKLITGACALTLVAGMAFAGDLPGEGKSVTPGGSASPEENIRTWMITDGLAELGYSVNDKLEVEFATLHLAIASGDVDFTAIHWDPLHTAFFDEAGGSDKMTKIGNLVSGALQGYLVDKASFDAGVKNLGDLKDPKIAARFDIDGDGKADLAGCVPGWGCERVIEHQLTEFGLRDTVTHNQGSYEAIIAETMAVHGQGKPILYYTWTPYWVSGVLVPGRDVEWIEVPYSSLPDGRKEQTTFEGREMGFAVNNIRVLANNKFLADNPAAAKFMELAKISINDVSAQILSMREGQKSEEAMRAWFDKWKAEHKAEWDGWIAEAKAATK